MTVSDLTTEPIYAGNRHTLRYTVADQDNAGVPKDLTGISARWALSKFKTDGSFSTTSILDKNSTNALQILISAPATGVIDVFLAEGDTTALAGDYYFELELYIPASYSLVVAAGTLTIVKNVVNV